MLKDNKKLRGRKLFFIGIVMIALGIMMSNVLKDSLKHFGIVLLGIGGLFFIAGMRLWKSS